MPTDEHDDDLSPTVDQRGEGQTEDFSKNEEEFEDPGREDDAGDEDVVGPKSFSLEP